MNRRRTAFGGVFALGRLTRRGGRGVEER